MDPVSLALSVAGILPLIATAIKCARGYHDSFVKREKSMVALTVELQALQTCLEGLNNLLTSDTMQQRSIKFHDVSVLRSCCSAIEGKLKEICQQLSLEPGGKQSRFLWPLREKEIEKMIQCLRNFTLWIRLSLSIDGCNLLSRTSEDVLQIMGHQLGQFKSMQSIEVNTTKIHDAIQVQTSLVQDLQKQQARLQILDWICPTKYDQKHANIRASRVPETGSWLLQEPLYSRWKEGDPAVKKLWCHGIQGAGKTNLVSIIIDDLIDDIHGSGSFLAYFYFDHQDHMFQSPRILLNSVLRQLVEALPKIPGHIHDLHKLLSGRSSSIPQHECERQITQLAAQSRRCFLVMDALDECDRHSYRHEVLQVLKRLEELGTINMLVTSRSHTEDIRTALGHYPQLKIAANVDDIRCYLKYELDRNNVNQNFGEDFTQKLIQILSNRADGMFLLPVLQLRTIIQEPSRGEMEEALKTLSHGLDEAFMETLKRIECLPEGRRRLALRTLMWVCHAKRPLKEEELLDILALRPGQKSFDSRYRPCTNVVLECCQGFVMVDPETKTVRPAHHAVQEYLLANSDELFPRAQVTITCTCMEYLLFKDFSDGPWDDEEEIERRATSYAFLSYASSHWGTHARVCEEDPRVMETLENFLHSTYAAAVATQVGRFLRSYKRVYWDAKECRSTTPFHHAARRGLALTLATLLETGIDANIATEMGSTAINYAASHNHVDVVKTLLRYGANPYIRNWYGDALHCAIESGSIGAIRVLVDSGMGIDRDYLGRVLDHDRGEAFEAIIDMGGAKNVDLPLMVELFHEAAESGCLKVIEVFIRRKLVDLDCTDKLGRTVLHYAAMSLNPEMVKILVCAGLDRNHTDKFGKCPMDYVTEIRTEVSDEDSFAAEEANSR